MVFICRWMRSQQTFLHVVARLGAILNVPAAICLLSALLGLIGADTLSVILLLIALFSVGTAVFFTLNSLKRDSGGLDPFYGMIVAFVFTGVVMYILSKLLS